MIFYLTQFNSETSDLYLFINSAIILDISIRIPSYKIPCMINQTVSKWTVSKFHSCQLGIVQISLCNTFSTNPQFTRDSDAAHCITIHNISMSIAYRLTNKYLITVRRTVIPSGIYTCLCWSVKILQLPAKTAFLRNPISFGYRIPVQCFTC